VAVGFFLEKQLAALRHLFPAKNPTATPRRRALAGSRLKRRVWENPKLNLLTGCQPPQSLLLPASLNSPIPVLPVGRGGMGYFSDREKDV
jgi:hypothetical protein